MHIQSQKSSAERPSIKYVCFETRLLYEATLYILGFGNSSVAICQLIDSSIVKLDMFEVICTQNVLT